LRNKYFVKTVSYPRIPVVSDILMPRPVFRKKLDKPFRAPFVAISRLAQEKYQIILICYILAPAVSPASGG